MEQRMGDFVTTWASNGEEQPANADTPGHNVRKFRSAGDATRSLTIATNVVVRGSQQQGTRSIPFSIKAKSIAKGWNFCNGMAMAM